MPTYDFLCGCCSSRFSAFTGVYDRSSVTCPECESTDLTQVFSGFNFISKGTNPGGSRKKSCSGNCCSSCSGC